jgi:hypothetical protein
MHRLPVRKIALLLVMVGCGRTPLLDPTVVIPVGKTPGMSCTGDEECQYRSMASP